MKHIKVKSDGELVFEYLNKNSSLSKTLLSEFTTADIAVSEIDKELLVLNGRIGNLLNSEKSLRLQIVSFNNEHYSIEKLQKSFFGIWDVVHSFFIRDSYSDKIESLLNRIESLLKTIADINKESAVVASDIAVLNKIKDSVVAATIDDGSATNISKFGIGTQTKIVNSLNNHIGGLFLDNVGPSDADVHYFADNQEIIAMAAAGVVPTDVIIKPTNCIKPVILFFEVSKETKKVRLAVSNLLAV